MKVNVEEGYVIKGVYSGKDTKTSLVKDGDDYYLLVPKGGGVYLNVELEKERKAEPDKDDEDEDQDKNKKIDPELTAVRNAHRISKTAVDRVLSDDLTDHS